MTTLTATSISVARNSVLSDFSVRAMCSRPPRRPTGQSGVDRSRLSGQQSSVGLGKDTSLTDQYGLCSQRLAPCRSPDLMTVHLSTFASGLGLEAGARGTAGDAF